MAIFKIHLVFAKVMLLATLQGVLLHQRTEFDDNPPIHGAEIARR